MLRAIWKVTLGIKCVRFDIFTAYQCQPKPDSTFLLFLKLLVLLLIKDSRSRSELPEVPKLYQHVGVIKPISLVAIFTCTRPLKRQQVIPFEWHDKWHGNDLLYIGPELNPLPRLRCSPAMIISRLTRRWIYGGGVLFYVSVFPFIAALQNYPRLDSPYCHVLRQMC